MFTNSFSYPNLFNATTGKCQLEEDYESILNRVGLLLKAHKGEEFMFPNFGSYFPDVLMSYNSEATIKQAKENIVKSITEFEPFVDANMISIQDESEGNNLKLAVTLVLDKDFRELAGTVEWSFNQEGGSL